MGSNAGAAGSHEAGYFFTNALPQGGADIPNSDIKMGSSVVAEEGVFRDDQIDQVDEMYGRRKKRRVEETSVASVMEGTSRALESTLVRVVQAQIDAYNRNSELDRIQRQTINQSLVGVLEKLAESVSRVAERL